LQTGEFPGWDRSPDAFIRTSAVSQFAKIATTSTYVLLLESNGNNAFIALAPWRRWRRTLQFKHLAVAKI